MRVSAQYLQGRVVWCRHVASPSLSFLVYKLEMIIIQTSRAVRMKRDNAPEGGDTCLWLPLPSCVGRASASSRAMRAPAGRPSPWLLPRLWLAPFPGIRTAGSPLFPAGLCSNVASSARPLLMPSPETAPSPPCVCFIFIRRS